MSNRNTGGKAVGGPRKRENIGKMRDLLSKASDSQAVSMFTQSMQRRLEFSNLSLCVYNGHKILINDIFLNPNINTFVSFNDKSLHSWNPETMEIISQINFNDADIQQSQQQISQIQCLCYSSKYYLYFACSKDFKLFVFNEHLNLIFWQRMPVGLVQIIYFNELEDQLFVGGKEGCYIIDLDINFKYKPRMAIMLDPKGQSISVKIKKEFQETFQGTASVGPQSHDSPEIMGFLKTSEGAMSTNVGKRKEQQFARSPTLDKGYGDVEEKEPGNDNMPVNFSSYYGSHIKQLQGISEWVKGIKIFESQNLIVVWKKEILSSGPSGQLASEEQQRQCRIKATKDQVIFYSLKNYGQYQQGEIWARYYDPSIKEDFITDILVFKEQKFFITSHNSGDIHLRKLIELKNIDIDVNEKQGGAKEALISAVQNNGQKSVHVFKGHSRTVTSLAPIKSKNTYFVSASLDGKVRIWDYEKMIELYCFDIALDSPVQNSANTDSIMNVKLINDKIYAMIFKSFIEIGLISHLASSYFISKQSVCSLGKCYKGTKDMARNRPDSLFISFNDNSIVLLNPLDQYIKCTIYPPPTPAEVSIVFYCTSIERVFLLLVTGAICIYKIDKETGSLEKLQESKSMRDYEGKSLSQQITSIGSCYTEPPQYDCEIFSDLYKYKEPTDPEYRFVEDPDGGVLDHFMVIGLSKGTILFVKVNDLDHIFARFSIHRQAVTQIHEVKAHKLFISICEENILNIWGFEKGRDQVYQKFNLHRELFSIVVARQSQLMMCFKTGDSELFLWNDPKKRLERLPVDKTDEHEDEFTCCDVLPDQGMFVSGDRDGLVKIWNQKKQLVREIKFVEPVNSVIFLNEEGDIIVGHSGNLNRLNASEYMDSKMLIRDQEYEEFLSQGTPIDEHFFRDILFKPNKESHTKHSLKENSQKQHTSIPQSDIDRQRASGERWDENQSRQSKGTAQVKKSLVHPTQTPASSLGLGMAQPSTYSSIQYQLNSMNIQKQGSLITSQAPGQTSAQPHHLNIQTPFSGSDPPVMLDQVNASQSNHTGSQMNSSVRAKNLKQQLNDIKAQCAKTPSVPTKFVKCNKMVKAREKELFLMNNSTRRMMTEKRIQANIMKGNNPCELNNFNDILISQSVSHENIQFAHKILASKANKQNRLTQSQYNRSKYGSKGTKMPQIMSTKNTFNRATLSELTQLNTKTGFREATNPSQVSNMNIALQQMANSANNFSIFDQNFNFDTQSRFKSSKLNALNASAPNSKQALFHPKSTTHEVLQAGNHVIISMHNQILQQRRNEIQGKQNSILDEQTFKDYEKQSNNFVTTTVAIGNKSQFDSNNNISNKMRLSDENISLSKDKRDSAMQMHKIESSPDPHKTYEYASTVQKNIEKTKYMSSDAVSSGPSPNPAKDRATEKENQAKQRIYGGSSNNNSPTINHQNSRLVISNSSFKKMEPHYGQKSTLKNAEFDATNAHSDPNQGEYLIHEKGEGIEEINKQNLVIGQQQSEQMHINRHFAIEGDEAHTLPSKQEGGKTLLDKSGEHNLLEKDQTENEATFQDQDQLDKNRFYVVQKLKQQEDSKETEAKSPKIVDEDVILEMQKTHHLPGTQNEEDLQYKEQFSCTKIMGTNRGLSDGRNNQFVATRVLQRKKQLQPVKPHLITNVAISTEQENANKGLNKFISNSSMRASDDFKWKQERELGKSPPNFYSQIEDTSPMSRDEREQMMKSMGTGGFEVQTKTGFVELHVSPGQRLNNPQIIEANARNEYKEKAPLMSGIASQRTGSQSMTYYNQKAHKTAQSFFSPGSMNHQTRQKNSKRNYGEKADHQSLAAALLDHQVQAQYGLSSNQTTKRKGANIESHYQHFNQATTGHVVYVKNVISSGSHMPSKGIFNYQSRQTPSTMPITAKPRTAGYSRKTRFQQLMSKQDIESTKMRQSIGMDSNAWGGQTRLQSEGYNPQQSNFKVKQTSLQHQVMSTGYSQGM